MKVFPGKPAVPPKSSVEAYQKASRVRPKEATSEPRSPATDTDRVELSPRSREFQQVLATARAAPLVREDRIEAARQTLAEGRGSSRVVAEKLLAEHLDLHA